MQVNFSINIDDKLVERVKTFFSKRNTIVIVLIFTVAVTTVILNGESITKKWLFSSGDIIYANRINENFDALYVKVNQLDAKLGGDELVPCGTIVVYGGTIRPDGWLFCDGKTYDTAQPGQGYLNDLRIRLQGGSSSTEFSVPDLRGCVVVGVTTMGTNTNPPSHLSGDTAYISKFNALNKFFGNPTHTLQDYELAPHNHVIESQFYWGNGNISVTEATSGGTSVAKQGVTASLPNDGISNLTAKTPAGSAQPFNIIQPSRALNYIIKY